MISVKNLTKKFGTTTAVDGINFEIPKGQLVGFLGPNGAGKTTTMRLLTGYLPVDEGEAKLMGHDLHNDSIEIRSRLGYLAENNPLPDDIEVTEYLHYIGQLRGFFDCDERMERVKKVLKLCSLQKVIGKKLGELSKGFKQRVGLAQAILHDPDILILDEPTSGLDPNQIQDVRDLIQDLKKEKTLLLSTHILTEVQNTCDRIIIINKGKVVADGSPSMLSGSMESVHRISVSLKGPADLVSEALGGLGGVLKVSKQMEDLFLLEAEKDLREDIFHLAVKKNWPIMGLKVEKLGLEEIFRTLTREDRR